MNKLATPKFLAACVWNSVDELWPASDAKMFNLLCTTAAMSYAANLSSPTDFYGVDVSAATPTGHCCVSITAQRDLLARVHTCSCTR